MDRILINDLRVRCIIGINDEERRKKQEVLINLSISADLGKPAMTDRFEDTLDYRALKKNIIDKVEASNFFLIEALAQYIAGICLENPMVKQVQVRVDKPSALRFAKSVAVEITRERKQ